MDEIASLTPLFAGVNYERLEGYQSLQWPVEEDGKDTPLLFTDKFPFPDGKAMFHPVEWIEPSEVKSDVFDLHLNNGRMLEHFEQGSMTYQTDGIKRLTPQTFVEVSTELAQERNMSSAARLSPMTLTLKSLPACTTTLIVSGCARSITTTWVAPACAIICASSQPPSMVLRSATMGTPGNSWRKARTPFMPSAMISGVPASSQSTPARMAMCAVSSASGMLVKSSEIWTMGFMRNFD